MPPFLTFYTPTYQRPQRLATCLASVAAQTVVDQIEQIVIPDHIGTGIVGMFQRIPSYAAAVHGQYVHILGDDDQLAAPDVVEAVQRCAVAHDTPPVILVRSMKGDWRLPLGMPWPPRLATIDLGNIITRADVWRQFVTAYGARYEGDFDYMDAIARAGYPAVFCDVLFVTGQVGRGLPERDRETVCP